jgi:hypothetical protein
MDPAPILPFLVIAEPNHLFKADKTYSLKLQQRARKGTCVRYKNMAELHTNDITSEDPFSAAHVMTFGSKHLTCQKKVDS